MCKSKALVFAQSRSKIIQTSFYGCKTVKRSTEKYFLQILLKNVGFIGKKPERGMGEMWNLVGNLIFLCSTKNLKITILSRVPFIVQIFSKYFHLSDHHKIFGASFYRSHSTRPTIFFTSFLLACCLLKLQLIL